MIKPEKISGFIFIDFKGFVAHNEIKVGKCG